MYMLSKHLECPSPHRESKHLGLLDVTVQAMAESLRAGQTIQIFKVKSHVGMNSKAKATNKSSIVVKCKRSQCLWSFCRGLPGLTIRDILALHCGRSSCYDVKVGVDRVKADVHVCCEGLRVCIAGPCHGVQALLQPCALISVKVLGLKSRWRAFQIGAPVLVSQFLTWCMLAKASLSLPSWLPRDVHQEFEAAGPNSSCEDSRVLNAP